MHLHDALRWSSVMLALALSAVAVSMASAAPRGEYVDASAYLQTDAEIEAWFVLRHGLDRNFDDICGDSFCEGDYSNIQSLRYVCSVHRVSGRIGTCGWTFAASDEMVEPVTGRIGVRHQSWFCRSPLSAGTTMESLLGALQGEEPLYATLPGTTRTLYDGLIDCL